MHPNKKKTKTQKKVKEKGKGNKRKKKSNVLDKACLGNQKKKEKEVGRGNVWEKRKKKKERKRKEGRGNVQTRKKRKKEKKKRRRKRNVLDEVHVQVHMGILVIYLSNSFHLVFSPFWNEKFLVDFGRKHLGTTIIFLSAPPNQTLSKKFSPHFLSLLFFFFSILLKFTLPNIPLGFLFRGRGFDSQL